MARHRYVLVEVLLIAAAALGTALAYPHLPARVPIHWDINGHPNGYGPRWTLYVLGSGLMAISAVLGLAMPWLSPKHFSVENFRTSFERVVLIVVGLFGYLNFAIVWSVVHREPHDPGPLVIGGLCFFSVALGNMLGKVRRNFFIGVRTPWTLANERVWNATHRFAAWTFVAMGLVGLGMTLLGWRRASLTTVLTGWFIPVVYSLVYYKRLERAGEL